jgi:hypothetical protein
MVSMSKPRLPFRESGVENGHLRENRNEKGPQNSDSLSSMVFTRTKSPRTIF